MVLFKMMSPRSPVSLVYHMVWKIDRQQIFHKIVCSRVDHGTQFVPNPVGPG
jgi:hypothetical protein